jgi:MerR family transcriptional regulator, redox-sensitive transcriptional activator SoxR
VYLKSRGKIIASLTIGEVVREAGVRASTLHYYESIGLLAPPRRVNGRRHYEADVLQRLAVIQAAKRAGFTIAEIGKLVHGWAEDAPFSAHWRPLATQKLPR